MERFNEKEFDLELGKCWIFKDKHSDVYIHTLGGHIQRIPKYHAEALKKYFSEEKIPQSSTDDTEGLKTINDVKKKIIVIAKALEFVSVSDELTQAMQKSLTEYKQTHQKEYPEWCPGREYCKTNNCDECGWEPIDIHITPPDAYITFKNQIKKKFLTKECRFIAPNRLILTIEEVK